MKTWVTNSNIHWGNCVETTVIRLYLCAKGISPAPIDGIQRNHVYFWKFHCPVCDVHDKRIMNYFFIY